MRDAETCEADGVVLGRMRVIRGMEEEDECGEGRLIRIMKTKAKKAKAMHQ